MSRENGQRLESNKDYLPSTLVPHSDTGKPRLKWPMKTLVEVLPILYALSGIFTYAAVKTEVRLVTPLQEVLGGVSPWVAGLMAMVAMIGLTGWVWIIYVFSRAPVAPDGSDEY